MQEESRKKYEEVEKRLKTLEKHPEEAIDFDKTIQNIEKKYGL